LDIFFFFYSLLGLLISCASPALWPTNSVFGSDLPVFATTKIRNHTDNVRQSGRLLHLFYFFSRNRCFSPFSKGLLASHSSNRTISKGLLASDSSNLTISKGLLASDSSNLTISKGLLASDSSNHTISKGQLASNCFIRTLLYDLFIPQALFPTLPGCG
jgi:hypothetical protein